MTVIRPHFDFGDLALNALDAVRLSIAAQVLRIEASVEVVCVAEGVVDRRGIGARALKPALQRGNRVQRKLAERDRIAKRAGAEPLLMEWSDSEVVTETPERMKIAMARAQPIDEFDAQLERAFGGANEIVFIDVQQLVEQLNDWNGRLADPD